MTVCGVVTVSVAARRAARVVTGRTRAERVRVSVPGRRPRLPPLLCLSGSGGEALYCTVGTAASSRSQPLTSVYSVQPARTGCVAPDSIYERV